jgi:hypothetical protein
MAFLPGVAEHRRAAIEAPPGYGPVLTLSMTCDGL